jgi:hypothetical protein
MDVNVMDVLPAGVTFISATPTQGSCAQVGGAVSCDLGALAAGNGTGAMQRTARRGVSARSRKLQANSSTATITIIVRPTTPDTLSNTASVTSNVSDPNPANNTTPAVMTTVNAAAEMLADLTGSFANLTQTSTAGGNLIFYGGAFGKRADQVTNSIVSLFNVQNQGNINAPSSTVRFFLSDDAMFSEGDILLGEVASGSVQAGTTKGVNLNVNLPAGVNATGKFVIAVVDATNIVAESNDGNNAIAFGPVGQGTQQRAKKPAARAKRTH